MYKINTINGDIHCADGFIISAPYDDPRYIEYAEWVNGGNSPEEIEMVVEPVPELISVFQAKVALLEMGLLDAVEDLMKDPETPRVLKLAWNEALEFNRSSSTIKQIASYLNISDSQLDNMFITASKILA